MLLVLGLAAFMSPAAKAQDWSTIRIATEGAYAPWNFTTPSGELAGFDVELAADLCARMEAECEIVAQAWDGIIPALQAGRYDAIMAGMSITDERREVIAFSRPYATTPAIFVVPKDSPIAEAGLFEGRIDMTELSAEEEAAIAALNEQVAGLVVGVQTATIHENFLREYLDDITIQAYDTQENLELDLEAGRIDTALADQSAWQPFLESAQGADFAQVGPVFARGIFGEGVGVGLRKEDAALLEKFDAAIAAAIEDGTITELTTKWFGFDSSPAS